VLYGPGRVITTLGLLGASVVYALFRVLPGPVVFKVVLSLLVLSGIAAVAFQLGRAHGKSRREK
jgi:hypothetical protein